MKNDRRVCLCHWERVEKDTLAKAIGWCGGWDGISGGANVVIKPNLTFPFYKPGVTTPPDTIRALTELLLERGAKVTICEGGPSLDSFPIWSSFEEHGILDLRDEYGISVVHLYNEPAVHRDFGSKRAGQNVPVSNILEDTDVYITMPLVKVHAMTTVSLALKNQWALIATKKRFLLHPALSDILVGLNALLPQPLVVCDARTMLDETGPAFGTPRPGGFLAVGNNPGAFDYVICQLMGFDPVKIDHIRAGIRAGIVPHSLEQITCNRDPIEFRRFKFTLRRSLQNYIAMTGFKNGLMCRLLYDSLVGDFLHRLLYAVKGNPLREAMEGRPLP